MKRQLIASVVAFAGLLVIVAGLLLAMRTSPLSAAPATGSVTGQVLHCAPSPIVRPQPQSSGPATSPRSSAIVSTGGCRWVPDQSITVAVQGTSLSARTDSTGHFRIDGVPVGEYLIVAAGPSDADSTAFVLRPNVFVGQATQTVDLGQLHLGAPRSGLPYPSSGAPGASLGTR